MQNSAKTDQRDLPHAVRPSVAGAGAFGRSLELIHVAPLHVGVLHFLSDHDEAKLVLWGIGRYRGWISPYPIDISVGNGKGWGDSFPD